MGALPTQLAALNQPNVVAPTVEAVLERSLDNKCMAVPPDPLDSSVFAERAKAMFDELL